MTANANANSSTPAGVARLDFAFTGSPPNKATRGAGKTRRPGFPAPLWSSTRASYPQADRRSSRRWALGCAKGSRTGPLTAVTEDPSASRSRAGVAFGGYLAVSLLLYGLPVISHLSSRFVGEGGGDSKLYVWDLSWWPHAIASGLNPFHPTVI